MGCLPVLKSKKKLPDQPIHIKRVNPQDCMPTALPEPQPQKRSLQSAPPSFNTRAEPMQPLKSTTNSRMRALSAPSSLDAAEQDALASDKCDDHVESKHRNKEHWSPGPQPLPLPSSQGTSQATSTLKTMGSFKAGNASGPLYASGPLPLPPSGFLRSFSYEEISAACQKFSPNRCMSEGLSSLIYKASFGDDMSCSKRLEATVTRLNSSTQGVKEFINEVNTLASLQHPNLCKLLGFHARESSEQRMLVYERLYHGSLDRLLYGRTDGPPIDWNTRMKVALCAAQGLAFLHEEGPFQAMYNEFSATNIQIDKDFSAKLSGYGCVSNAEICNSSIASANVSVETVERGLLTPKSNVWSFGIVLLELLTGRRNHDIRHPKEERNLVKWSRPFLPDDSRLSLIMDPQLKSRFPAKAARAVADITQRCLQTDPLERPTMRTVVEHLKMIQDMKHSCRFPLQEPAAIVGKQMFRSPSLNGVAIPAPRSSFCISPPSRARQQAVSTTGLLVVPLRLPLRACSSTLSLEEFELLENRRSTTIRRASVEGC